jgi:hypothetical protein
VAAEPPTQRSNGSGQTARAKPRLAVPVLRSLPSEQPVCRWRHWIVGVDDVGRVVLPLDARQVTDGAADVRAMSRDAALVLRDRGPGAEVRLDRRGRLVLPTWLRTLAESTRSVLVAAQWPEASVVVVSPTGSLDALADALAGEVG